MRAFTIRRALVAVIGATTLLVGSVGVLASASGAPLQTANQPGPNQTAYWVNYFTNLGYTGVKCVKFDDVNEDTFTVPAPDAGYEWLAAIVKAGSGDEANKIIMPIEEGQVLEHPTGKEISHVILCEVPETETTTTTSTTSKTTTGTTSSTTSSSTGPVVETDITGGSSSNGLMAWVALLLGGLALTLVGLRRPVRKH